MKLITKAIAKALPALYATDGQPEETRRCPLKLFSPVGAATWYICEFDPSTRMMFGLSYLGQGPAEWGYISLDELEAIRLPFRLKIERDRHWSLMATVADARQELAHRGAA